MATMDVVVDTGVIVGLLHPCNENPEGAKK